MTSSSAAVPRISLRGIRKTYGHIVANDGVDLNVARGGIHAIVGENGAGKTTLMKILSGEERPDRGTYSLDGRPIIFPTPAAAIECGIGMVHQRFQLVDELSALDNLVLGTAPRRQALLFDRARAAQQARALADQLRTRLDWNAPVHALGVGTRQRLEIMRLLYRRADTLIFDEPTSVLTPQEAEELFDVMRSLAAEGRTLLFITHKLREVFAVAEEVTVMRGGRVVASGPAVATDPKTVALQVVGEQLPQPRHRQPVDGAGEPVLEVRHLQACDDHGDLVLRGVDLTVREGEIVAVAGVEGNGQRELVEVLLGTRNPVAGEVRLLGRNCRRLRVRHRRTHGLAFISEDRDREGASLDSSLRDNACAVDYLRSPLSQAGVLNGRAMASLARSIIERFGVRGAGPDSPARSLSGGNLQRLIVGRELNGRPRSVIAAHPTRGVDLRGTAFIHQRLLAAREAGTGIVLVSSDISEVLDLADWVLVIFEGRSVALLRAGEVSAQRLGALMTGLAA